MEITAPVVTSAPAGNGPEDDLLDWHGIDWATCERTAAEAEDLQGYAGRGPQEGPQRLRSEHANTIGLSVASWVTSMKVEPAGVDRADRWGIFIGTWPATWFGLGAALARYEHTTEPLFDDA
ncbi:hypothetical protein ACWGCI_02595 [Streptomyces sp. NPDC054949]